MELKMAHERSGSEMEYLELKSDVDDRFLLSTFLSIILFISRVIPRSSLFYIKSSIFLRKMP